MMMNVNNELWVRVDVCVAITVKSHRFCFNWYNILLSFKLNFT